MLLETALLRAPLLNLKNQKWNEAIARYRVCLRAVESSATSSLRLTLARQLAEILLRRACQVIFENFLSISVCSLIIIMCFYNYRQITSYLVQEPQKHSGNQSTILVQACLLRKISLKKFFSYF